MAYAGSSLFRAAFEPVARKRLSLSDRIESGGVNAQSPYWRSRRLIHRTRLLDRYDVVDLTSFAGSTHPISDAVGVRL